MAKNNRAFVRTVFFDERGAASDTKTTTTDHRAFLTRSHDDERIYGTIDTNHPDAARAVACTILAWAADKQTEDPNTLDSAMLSKAFADMDDVGISLEDSKRISAAVRNPPEEAGCRFSPQEIAYLLQIIITIANAARGEERALCKEEFTKAIWDHFETLYVTKEGRLR